jgi:hypothetical protein
MAHHWFNVTYADISVMLGLALIVLWVWLCGSSLQAMLSQAALSLSGHFRPRPDQALECTLRTAFTQLDKELAVILDDRPIAHPRH